MGETIPAGIPWKSMPDVPKDGTIVAVKFHAWNVKANPAQIQMAQWIDLYGTGGNLCAPYDYDNRVFADEWCHLAELEPTHD